MTGLILVSGGGSGIGRDVALRLAAADIPVIVLGRRLDALRRTAATAKPGLVEVATADLSSVQGGEAVAAVVAGRPVWGVVAAAGAAGPRTLPVGIAEVDERWTGMLRMNFYTALFLVEAAIPHLVNGRARVVLISSTAAFDGGGGAYATSKAAVHGYGLDLARRLGPRGITANVVAPGHVPDTELLAGVDPSEVAAGLEAVIGSSLLGRAGQCSEVSSAIMWLLSPDAGWVTGQIISPNGGTILGR